MTANTYTGIYSEGFAALFGDCGGMCVKATETGTPGFSVTLVGNVCDIAYHTPTDFFRGVSIAYAKYKDGAASFALTEQPHFDRCGLMIDVSRNAVLTVDTVKNILRYMARMGLNQLMLYTEDTYKMDAYPYFGYMRGAYTKDEIKEIVAYADLFGIETVPCIQTLAHLAMTLHWRYAAPLRDTARTLFCGEEATYAFIEEMIKTCRECYHTDKIHIGMDEAFDVGTGAYLRKHGEVDRYTILTEHLKRVVEIVEKYDFKPMMWSDMFFRLGTTNGAYYVPNAKMPSDIAERIPKDMSLVYWDYYNTDRAMYEGMIKTHQTMKRKIIFAGGVWTWAGPAIHYDKTFATTGTALESCMANGITEVFATLWGDNGSECCIYSALLGMQLYAEYNYAGSDGKLRERFRDCAGLDMDTFLALGVDTFPEADLPSHFSGTCKQVLYQDILCGLMDKNLSKYDFKSHYKKRMEIMQSVKNDGIYDELYEYYRVLTKILYIKCDMGLRLTDAYAKNDKVALASYIPELKELKTLFAAFHTLAGHLWYAVNKPFGYEVLDVRFAGLEARTATAIERVGAYVSGTIGALPELEEKRLCYEGHEEGTEPAFIDEYNCSHVFTTNEL